MAIAIAPLYCIGMFYCLSEIIQNEFNLICLAEQTFLNVSVETCNMIYPISGCKNVNFQMMAHLLTEICGNQGFW
jgi:hypothetical protein